MHQVKIFEWADLLNKWLEDNHDTIEVIDIQFATIQYGYHIMVHYKDKQLKLKK